jgi:hypothetical protein
VFAKLKFVAVAALAGASGSSQALAQARAWEGCVLPVMFGSQGERHYFVNGYSGPFDPPMSSQNNATPAKRMSQRSEIK